MAKQPYTLMLDETLMAQVDALASSLGQSRSAFVESALAEGLALPTPYQQMRNVLHELERALRGVGLAGSFSGEGTLQLRSAIRFKYNPTVQYSLELATGQDDSLGLLKVAVRSQNQLLLGHMHMFFRLWAQTEGDMASPRGGPAHIQISDRRMTRTLRRPAGLSAGQVADALTSYVNTLDRAIKAYFALLAASPGEAAREVQRLYAQGLAQTEI